MRPGHNTEMGVCLVQRGRDGLLIPIITAMYYLFTHTLVHITYIQCYQTTLLDAPLVSVIHRLPHMVRLSNTIVLQSIKVVVETFQPLVSQHTKTWKTCKPSIVNNIACGLGTGTNLGSLHSVYLTGLIPGDFGCFLRSLSNDLSTSICCDHLIQKKLLILNIHSDHLIKW